MTTTVIRSQRITCNGPQCSAECSVLSKYWVVFVSDKGDRHLCPGCATVGNVQQQLYHQGMERIVVT